MGIATKASDARRDECELADTEHGGFTESAFWVLHMVVFFPPAFDVAKRVEPQIAQHALAAVNLRLAEEHVTKAGCHFHIALGKAHRCSFGSLH